MRHEDGTEDALRFLRWLYPEGPWMLTAIAVDKLGIDTLPFDARGARIQTPVGTTKEEMQRAARVADIATVADFLRHFQDRNIYYSLNQPREARAEKTDKSEIAAAHYLHVDIDPRVPDAGTDLEQHQKSERARILDKLTTPPAPIPRPPVCVYSGGGYQGLWPLLEPYVIAGASQPERYASAETFERYNIALEWAFGADHCHNVDRIMRLPGTVNWPHAKKRAKGQVPARARIEWIDTHTAFPIASFTMAAPVQTRSAGTGIGATRTTRGAKAASTVEPGNIKRYTIEELREKFPNLLKRTCVVIVQGEDPDDPNRHDGRSESLFRVCCDLIRASVPDDVIYSIITDPDFRISASVLDKRGSMERYAQRQIDRAKENAIDPWMLELNTGHAVIENFGGDCVVIEELEDPILNRTALSAQSFGAFKNRYMNRHVDLGNDPKGNPITKPLGKWWLEHEARRQYKTVIFAPEREVPNAYNLWKGFSVESIPGDRHAPFLEHVRENICSGDDAHYEYLLGWMARAVQQPACPGEVAVVLRGARGTGKSTFAKTFGSLFGRHYLPVSNSVHLVGNFNAQLRDAIVVFGDEAFFAGDKKHESVLKTLVTETTIQIERKGFDAETAPNFIHLIMASNDQWVVPAGNHERRYFVLDVGDRNRGDQKYFGKWLDELDEGGLSNLLWFLQHYDLSTFNVRDVPKTQALREQKILSLDTIEEWIFRKLEDGILLPNHLGWKHPVLKDALIDDYLMYTQRVGTRRSTATQVGKYLKRTFRGLISFQGTLDVRDHDEGGRRKEKRHFYEFPDLDKCREAFCSAGFGPYPWVDIEQRGVITDFHQSQAF